MLNPNFFRMKTTKKNRTIQPEKIFKQLTKKLMLQKPTQPPIYFSDLSGYKEMFTVDNLDINDHIIDVHYNISPNSTRILIIEKMFCATQGKYHTVREHKVNHPDEILHLKLKAVERIKRKNVA